MLLNKFSFGVLALWCMLGIPGPAFAQSNAGAPDPTSEEGKRAEGKARYERGAAAYSSGHYTDAIDLFLQADALAPSAALSFNIARAYEKIGDDAASLQWFRDFRRRAPDAKNGPEVDARIRALEGALAKKGVQQVTVLSTPLGATVIVDEQPVGVTPYTGQLPPGPHRVVLSLKGYADSEQKLELAADHAQDLSVPLVPAPELPEAPATSAASPAAKRDVSRRAAPVQRSDRSDGARFGAWPWVGLGAGAVVIAGSVGFELARRSAEDAARQETTQIGYKERLDTEQSRQTTARVLAGVGSALVVTGGVLLIIDLSSRPEASTREARLGAVCLPGGCGFNVRGQF